MKLTMVNVDEPGKIGDFVTSILNLEKHEYQEVLETINIKHRLEKVLHLAPERNGCSYCAEKNTGADK